MSKKMTKIVALIALVLLAIIPLAYAATEGTSSGTATVGNAAPTITSVSFTDTSEVSKDGSQIDVNTEYWAKATGVDDDNGLADLEKVEFIIWGPSSTEGGADSEADHYTFKWTQGTDTWEEVGPDSVTDIHLVETNCTDPASLPGDFRLAFKLDKIAEKTATATWTIKIIVTDDSAASASDATLSFGVNYYGEITVNDGTHGWTGLTVGATDVIMNNPDGDLDVTVTSNAAFDLQAKGSGDLTKGGDTIPLANVVIHKDTLGSAVSLTTSYADIGGLTSLSAGSDLAHSFILWIDVPDPCPTGDYTYTLSIQIVES